MEYSFFKITVLVSAMNPKHFHEKRLRITHKGEPLLTFLISHELGSSNAAWPDSNLRTIRMR